MKIKFAFILIFLFWFSSNVFAKDVKEYGKINIDLELNAKLVIEWIKFKKENHVIEYDKETGAYVRSIDGETNFLPNDFDLPVTEIMRMSVFYNDKVYILSTNNLYDIDEHGKYTFSCENDVCKLKLEYGDGAAHMDAIWEINQGQTKRILFEANP